MIVDPMVNIEDVRRAGLCVKGARRWFEMRKLSFNDFLKDGLPESTLAGLNDAFANRVIAKKRERSDG